MPHWVIGDVHGCAATLERLLTAIDHDPARDHLHFVGDLINRGPDNLGVLRRVRDLGDRATAVLGNHEVHLLGVAAGLRELHRKDTLHDILAEDETEGWVNWIATWPLLRTICENTEHRALVVHAGIHPSRTLAGWKERAAQLQARLKDPSDRHTLLSWANAPTTLDEATKSDTSARWDLAVLTRMRACHADGRLDMGWKGPPADLPDTRLPWYELLAREPERPHLFTGHWAAHGFARLESATLLDSGCVWGGELTALCLETGDHVSVPALEMR